MGGWGLGGYKLYLYLTCRIVDIIASCLPKRSLTLFARWPIIQCTQIGERENENMNDLFYFEFKQDGSDAGVLLFDGFMNEVGACRLWSGFGILYSVTVYKNGEVWR